MLDDALFIILSSVADHLSDRDLLNLSLTCRRLRSQLTFPINSSPLPSSCRNEGIFPVYFSAGR